MAETTYRDVIAFWFEEIEPASWWKKEPAFDRLIQSRFGTTHDAARAGELLDWRSEAEGRLAEIIVLDQFSRNIYRDTAEAFAFDDMALALAQEAVALGMDKPLSAVQRSFMYMPYMHSESKKIHEIALQLYSANGIQSNLDFEIQHKQIIDQFGRYPHRNNILGRESTAAELAYLQNPDAGF